MTTNLARVHWRMGQTLLPEHFIAQEEALAAEAVAHLRASGLPHCGIAALQWNDNLLATGVLSLRSLTAVLPSGALVDVPRNARVEPLNLNGPGRTDVSAYLHVLEDEPGRDEDVRPEGAGVARRTVPLALGCDPDQARAVETIHLGEFRKGPDGAWRLRDTRVPPLLHVGASPYLERPLAQVLQALEGFESQLLQESARSLAAASLPGLHLCWKGLHRLRRVLAAPRGRVYLHPYQVYEALRDFHVDVCLYRQAPLRNAADVYDHEDLARLFQRVIDPLCDQLGLAGKPAPYLSFQLRGGAYCLDLPEECRGAREVYLLVQKPSVDRAASLGGLKLAAGSRLPLVHKLALQGIPVERRERPAAAHAFGPEVEFYALHQGEEWEHALREGTVAFYGAPELGDLTFYLYWRRG
jgi:type VI secretion system protein ImpJ